MIIELQRQWIPVGDEAGEPAASCGVCSHALEDLSVVAVATTDNGMDMGLVCFSCVEYLGRRNPERFPTPSEYRGLLERYPEPMYPNMDALEAAGVEAGYLLDPVEIAVQPSWVWSGGAVG